MSILVFNSGSSSLKCRYFQRRGGVLTFVAGGDVTGFGARADWTWHGPGGEQRGTLTAQHHGEAARWAISRWRQESPSALEGVGHRLVHGGERFHEPALLTEETLAHLEALNPLAPLHNPLALDVIRACCDELGEAVPMVAVFDTAFHAGLPAHVRRYALPTGWTEAHGIYRYGFHGIAHRYMYERYLALRGRHAAAPRVITFQLGNGCSVAAIRGGRSVDTSMGFTALSGLIMSTRPGEVDPGALLQLVESGVTPAALREGLYQSSGLVALSGKTGSMRRLLELEAEGDDGARLAVAAFCHRARHYLGAYLAALGGADAIVFGGGIGERAPAIRARICEAMAWCGLTLDAKANAEAVGTEARISSTEAEVEAFVVSVDEELLIAGDTLALLAAHSRA